MALSKEIYRQFEDIVGSANISDDPALLDSYRYSMSHTANHLGPFYNAYSPRGEAVMLPGSTEEVQAIVKLCNKYKLKAKASSTFWSAMGFPSGENTIQLDMRRMNRVLDIDVNNMFAVIEPYVIGANLQAEAMKVGLNTHIIGAGCSCSPLASATNYAGPGPDSLFMGFGNENMLGTEWVMPDGEILRSGTLGSGLGWYHGDGPGPSIRGFMRGAIGPQGGLGIATKVALKLYPWPGPTELPVTGRPPAYQADLPDNFRAYTLAFPSWESFADACYQIWDAGIGYISHRQFNFLGRDLKGAMIRILTNPDGKLSDLEDLLEDPELQQHNQEALRDFEFVIAGMTARDMKWQEKVLDDILEETGGWKVTQMFDPVKHNWMLLYLIRLGHKNLNLVYGGSYDGCVGMFGATPDFAVPRVEEAADFKQEWEKKGNIVAGGGDCMMGGLGVIGGGGGSMWENFTCFDPYDQESTEGTLEFFDASAEFMRKRGVPVPMEKQNAHTRGPDGRALPEEERNRMLSQSSQPQAFRYQQKIKDAFDPNDLGDQYYYTITEEDA